MESNLLIHFSSADLADGLPRMAYRGWRMAYRGWRTADGGWRTADTADGGWRMAYRGWRMAYRGWRTADGSPRWLTADAKMKVSAAENTEVSKILQAWSGLEYSFACFDC